jgi:hypothetical protein
MTAAAREVKPPLPVPVVYRRAEAAGDRSGRPLWQWRMAGAAARATLWNMLV